MVKKLLLFFLFLFCVCSQSFADIKVGSGSSPIVGSGASINRNTQNIVDLFFIMWQSNAVGVGDSGTSTPCTNALEVHTNGTIEETVTDPVGQTTSYWQIAHSGSAWPSFACEWYAQTGRTAAILSIAHGDTTVSAPYANGYWYGSGGLWTQAITAVNAAKSTLESAGYTVNIAGAIVWGGESDSIRIRDAVITQQDFIDDCELWFADIYSEFNCNVFIIRPMAAYDSLDTQLVLIRAGLTTVDSDLSYAHVVFNNEYTSPPNANWHCTQSQYDTVGSDAAGAIATILGY